MKKMISLAAALAAVSALTFSAFADVTVHVTIADENGKLAVADDTVEVSDLDGDDALTINDALIAAHDKYYEGGADAGYASAEGDYGPMITKLWGAENGGSYGYYVNNTAAMGLGDAIKDGDHINAFVYTDLTAWSDKYCYFDKSDMSFEDVDPTQPFAFDLTLSGAAFDENWAPITVPVEGAEITVNDIPTGLLTDSDGKISVVLPAVLPGTYIISAKSDKETLVPPVCKVNITVDANAAAAGLDDLSALADAAGIDLPDDLSALADAAGIDVSAGDVAAATDSSKGSPDTGVEDVAVFAGIAVIAAGALIVSKKRK